MIESMHNLIERKHVLKPENTVCPKEPGLLRPLPGRDDHPAQPLVLQP